MKKIALIFCLIASFAAIGNAQRRSAAKPDPAKGVKEAFDRLIDGIKQVDADKVMSAYEKSDRLLIFNNNGTATIGWDNVKSNVVSYYAKVSNVSLEITGLRIEMLGSSAAYLSCKWKQSQEIDGTLEEGSGRMTLVYRLIGKEWKVVHRHTSPDNPPASRPVLPSERSEP